MALVVFIRGVNVGGRRTFRPTRIAAALRRLDAVNIGAAGTFVVRRPVGRTQLRAAIARTLPFNAEIVICGGREIARLARRNPFAGLPVRKDTVRFVSVLSRRPRPSRRPPFRLPRRGAWLVKVLGREGRFVVGLHRRRMRVIALLGELDRMFGARATTRSWSTIQAVAEALRSPAAG